MGEGGGEGGGGRATHWVIFNIYCLAHPLTSSSSICKWKLMTAEGKISMDIICYPPPPPTPRTPPQSSEFFVLASSPCSLTNRKERVREATLSFRSARKTITTLIDTVSSAKMSILVQKGGGGGGGGEGREGRKTGGGGSGEEEKRSGNGLLSNA